MGRPKKKVEEEKPTGKEIFDAWTPLTKHMTDSFIELSLLESALYKWSNVQGDLECMRLLDLLKATKQYIEVERIRIDQTYMNGLMERITHGRRKERTENYRK